MNMPVLSEWNPTAAAKMFLEEKTRRTRDIKTGNEQSKHQSCFKGVFSEASQYADDDENENFDANEEGSFFDF